VLLSAHLLGWPFAGAGVAGALVLGAGGAMAASALRATGDRSAQDAGVTLEPPREGFGKRWWAFFDERLFRVAGWFLLGLLGAGYVDTFVPPGALSMTGPFAQLVIAGALALATSICAPAVLPLLASLVEKGLDPGVALVGLLLGPAGHLLAASWSLGRARGAAALLGLGALAWGIGAVVSRLLEGSAPQLAATSGSGGLEGLAVVVLGAVLARRVWHTGIRSWMGASLTERGADARRGHTCLELHAH
jgi:hypothetical protein